jgi:hypothetical protein
MSPHTPGDSETVSALLAVSPRGGLLSKREASVNSKLHAAAIYVNGKKLLGILPSRMPGGAREERLRAWVSKRLKRRGVSAALARHLDRHQSWVTMYSAAERDADFDTCIQIAEFFRVTLASIVGEVELPDDAQGHDSAPTKPLTIKIATVAAALERLRDDASRESLTAAVIALAQSAGAQPLPERIAELARVPVQEVPSNPGTRKDRHR